MSFYWSAPWSEQATSYDIQGEIVSEHPPPQGPPTGWFETRPTYAEYLPGPESEWIPATAPSLQAPMIPGQVLTSSQKADLTAQIPVPQSPLESAISANVEAAKDMDIITTSAEEERQAASAEGVLAAVPTIA